MSGSAGDVTAGGAGVQAGGEPLTAAQETNFLGPDKLVGLRILSATSLRVLYWENVKSLDVQRMANSIVVSIEEEKQEAIGLGRESFKDVDVRAVLYMLEQDPLGISDENAFEGYLQVIHDALTQYSPYSGLSRDTVGGNNVVWVKIVNERRAEDVRGIILYEISFQVRIYVGPGTVTPYGQNVVPPVITTGNTIVTVPGPGIVMASLLMMGSLMQVMAQFLAGLPAGTVSAWNIVPFVTTKSVDLQRAGNTVAIGAPTGSGRIIGLGLGQMGSGSYSQQQVTEYTFKLTLWTISEQDIVAATDWITANSLLYFLNLPYDGGQVVMSKMTSFGQKQKERGVWWRTLDLMLEVVIGV
jgi:hypothetical protein